MANGNGNAKKIGGVGGVIAIVAAAIAIIGMPQLSDIYTRTEAQAEHVRIEGAAKSAAKEEYEKLYEVIRAQQLETSQMRKTTESRLETIDARTWQILREMKRR